MKKSLPISLLFLPFLLVGCGETMADLKDAVSGINSKANEAAEALGEDVHALRSIEINYNNVTFTVNDLFKTILRDVQWFYEPKRTDSNLRITGTWQPDLSSTYEFTDEEQKILLENGKVITLLTFEDGALIEDKTVIKMFLDDEIIAQETGTEALHKLFVVYISK